MSVATDIDYFSKENNSFDFVKKMQYVLCEILNDSLYLLDEN
jgi:hypothetical protein